MRLLRILLLFLFVFTNVGFAQTDVLRLWIMPSGIDLTRRIGVEVRAFEEMNPNVRVEVEFISWSEALEFYQQASGDLRQPPDVLQIGTTWISSLAEEDLLYAYTPEEIEAVGGSEAFVESVWQDSNYNGETVGLPWFIDTRATIYRRDLFEQVGLDPEVVFSNWEEFDLALQTLRDADLFVYTADDTPLQIYPIAIPGRPETNAVHDFAPWIWGAGGDFLNEEFSEATFYQDPGFSGIQFYTSFYPKGYTPPDIQTFTIRDSDSWFINRRVAMTISGAWIIQRLRTTGLADDIGVAIIPEGPAGRYTFLGGSSLAVWKDSPQPEAAVALAQFMVSPESQARYTQNAGLLPARVEILESDIFANDPEYSVFAEAIEFGRTYPPIDDWASVEVTLTDSLETLWQQVVFDPNTTTQPETLREQMVLRAVQVNQILGE